MIQKYVVGVDISKSKIDCAVMDSELKLLIEKEVTNSDQKIEIFLKNLLKKLNAEVSEVLVCCENTGIYNRPLERVSGKLGINLWVEHALKIKRASTDMRGKNDRKDAIRIAEYAIRYSDKQVNYQEPGEIVKEINILTRVRENLLNQKVAIENQLREAKSHDTFEYEVLRKGYKIALKAIEKSIKETEGKIQKLTLKDREIARNTELLTSIPGIGLQCAISLITATNNFKSFTTAKHLACYAGVVPFQNQSGVIVKRERVSKMANKSLKRLLHMAAMAAIRFNKELKAYYIRKVSEGKNKMSVLNAVRNKLVHRVMSVIVRQTPFLEVEDFFLSKKKEYTCILT
jgi:transposase